MPPVKMVTLAVALLVVANSKPARAETAADIDILTNQIIQKEIDFLKLNTRLKLNESASGRWAPRRWFGFNLANTTLTVVGAYINGFGRFSYLHKNRLVHAPRDLAEHAAWIRGIANYTTVAGGVGELSRLVFRDWQAQRKGVDLGQTRKYADNLQDELDAMISQREAAISHASLSTSELELAHRESAVLKDVRNLAINEYIHWYTQGLGNRAFNYTGFAVSIASNALAGAGVIVANHATMINHGDLRWRTRLAGTGGICDIIAGSTNQTVPFVTRGVSWIARHHSEGKLAAMLDREEPGELTALHEHQRQYHELIGMQPELSVHGVVARDGVFAKEASILDEHERLRLGEVKAGRKFFMSQLVFFTATGSSKMINGIGTTVGQFNYWKRPHERFESIGGAAITYGTGYAIATTELIRNQFWNEINNARARRLHTMPTDIIKGELDELDAIKL